MKENALLAALKTHGYDGYNEPNRALFHIEHIYKLQKGLYTPPVMIEVSPTSICNHVCEFCYTYQREKNNMLSEKAMIEIGRAHV